MLLRANMSDDEIPARRASDPASEASAPLRVLIVDDDPHYRRFLDSVVRRHGWLTSTAEDGEAAFAIVGREAFDLLVVDYEMPRVNGMEFIGRVRRDEAARHVYAVMLTARDNVETKIAALTAGFDDFMPKSAAEAEIVAKLLATRRVLARQQNLDVAMRRLYGLATRDELTGVFNRRFFLDETAALLERNVPLCLVLFDLDDFKVVNDTYGHLAGDRILRDVGALFHAATRAEDLIARYGGDEFVLVATRVSLPVLERLTARLVAGIGELRWSAGTRSFGISATTGTASSTLLPSASVEQLLNAADRDLYKNKWLRKHPRRTAAMYDALPPREDLVIRSPTISDDRLDNGTSRTLAASDERSARRRGLS
jgi:two-component system chemotaxis response regulator CheY